MEIEAGSISAATELLEIAEGKPEAEEFRAQAIATFRIAARRNADRFQSVALPVLVQLIDDPDLSVRREAVLTVGLFGKAAEAAIPKLLRSVEVNRGMDIELFAAESLGRIGMQPEQVIPVLIQMVPGRMENGSARWARGPELDAIGMFGGAAADAVPVLEKALYDTERSYGLRAAQALAKVQPANVRLGRFLSEAYRQGNDEERHSVLLALKEIPSASRTAELKAIVASAINDPDPENQKLAEALAVN